MILKKTAKEGSEHKIKREMSNRKTQSKREKQVRRGVIQNYVTKTWEEIIKL